MAKTGENRRKQEKTGEKGITEKILESYIDVFSDILNVLLFNGEEIIHPDEPEDQTPRSACKADGKIRDKVMSQLTAACPITGCIFYSPFSLNLLMQCLICAAADRGGFSFRAINLPLLLLAMSTIPTFPGFPTFPTFFQPGKLHPLTAEPYLILYKQPCVKNICKKTINRRFFH